jgi:hypothetical protein
MNAPVQVSESALLGDLNDFRECCAQQRWFCELGILPLSTAVDNLQWLAERWDLISMHGQDTVQDAMGLAFAIDVEPVHEEPALAEPPRRRYQTPQSTIDAFWYVVRLDDTDYLGRWLADHPLDAPHLHEIWRAKCLTAAAV